MMITGRSLFLMISATAIFIGAANSGCAHNRHYETDKDNPAYHGGQMIPANVPVPVAQDTQVNVGAPGEIGAGVAALATTAAVANSSEYYRKISIEGDCVIKASPDELFEVPCNNVMLAAVDANNKEITRAQAQGGKFRMYVPENKSVWIKLATDRYEMTPEKLGPVGQGDQVIVRLIRRYK